MSLTLTPYLRAMALRVSPERTVWRLGLDPVLAVLVADDTVCSGISARTRALDVAR
jgi:hypothetical protein